MTTQISEQMFFDDPIDTGEWKVIKAIRGGAFVSFDGQIMLNDDGIPAMFGSPMTAYNWLHDRKESAR